MGTQLLDNDTVFLLLGSGFLDPCYQDCEGNTLLHLSILDGNHSLTEKLLHFFKQGEQTHIGRAINLQNNNGDTPLHIASRKFPKSRLVLLLVELGAQMGIPNHANEVVEMEDEEVEVEQDTEVIVQSPTTSVTNTIVLLSPGWEKMLSSTTSSDQMLPQSTENCDSNEDSVTVPNWLTIVDENEEDRQVTTDNNMWLPF